MEQGLPHQSTDADEEAEKDEERTEFTWQMTHHLTHLAGDTTPDQ